MGIREKYILYGMIKDRLLATVQIPRGYGKSIKLILWGCEVEAFKRTNYILDAIGEEFSYEDKYVWEQYMLSRN